ncbi:hypothetical protein OS493_039513 [Desmophyllum pertusum]|uniref:Uncharacterized protein n=1 Tax=Desmophyllum pertusum TaxID=174260 RepID=A0A9X0CN27_9CNID|nr:hypothetical protein OS493_039513 [Desmophyllum pertusum]
MTMASFRFSCMIPLSHQSKKEKFYLTFTHLQMDSNGTRTVGGIVQHLTVPGMASVVTTTHTLKLLCWLTTIWMVFFLPIYGKIRNVMSLCTPGNPRLRGRIGDFLFGNMSKLLTVVFNAASIAGNIPEDLAQLRSLQNFLGCIMDGEGFTGRIPEDIGNMTELRVLCLGGNNLTGQIPRSITRLKKLWYLDLRNTPGKMQGQLSDLFAIPSLTDMFISGVELIGEMPHMLPEKIRYLVLPGNNISGKFPQTFPKTNSLGMLNVANNQLTGDVPGQLLLLPGIDMIDLSQNKFSSINRGRSWSKNDSATVKSFISLAGNRNLSLNFTSFMELFSKQVDFVESPSILNLSFCDIKSPVPANLFYLERMSTCDLRGNRFYGEIPTFLEDFSFLTYFDISSNNLSGSLPVGIQILSPSSIWIFLEILLCDKGLAHRPMSLVLTSQKCRGKNARSLISITVFYIQTMDFMVSSANVWPQTVVAAQKYLSSYWNLYFPSLSCDFPTLFTPVGKFAFLLLLPVVCMATVGLYFVILLTYNKVRPHQRRMEKVHFKCRQSAFFCLSFSYFPIVKQTLSILRPCHNDRDVLYMPNSPWIECTSLTYNTLTALGVVSVVFYVIGFPLFLISLLLVFFRKRKNMSPEDRQKLDAWLGPVYLPYKPKYQPYFEIVMLFRRLFLAIALSMISSSSTLQTFLVWLILMVSAIIDLRLQPYNERSSDRCTQENFFEPLVLFVLSMSFILLRFSALDSSYTSGFVWVVMIVNICVLVALVGAIFYLLVSKGNGRDNGSSVVGNMECGDGALEDDENDNVEDRSHLLPVNNVVVDDVA